MEDADSMGPPWIVFADQGKSLAILPAGRPGEVADVRDIPEPLVRRLVECANAKERGAYAGLERLCENVQLREESSLRDVLRDTLRHVALCGRCLRPATYQRALTVICDAYAADPELEWDLLAPKESCLLRQAGAVRRALALLGQV